jgi:hypothetical protein
MNRSRVTLSALSPQYPGNAIPKSDHEMPSVLTAAELLSLAAEHGGPIEFARIATLKALNRHAERGFNPERKDTRKAEVETRSMIRASRMAIRPQKKRPQINFCAPYLSPSGCSRSPETF